jgi:hypothetical protein
VKYGNDEPNTKEIEYSLQEAQKQVLKTNIKKTTKIRPLFIKILMKSHLRSSLSHKPQRKYERLSNKNTKVLTELKRFILCEVNLNHWK